MSVGHFLELSVPDAPPSLSNMDEDLRGVLNL